MPRNQGLAVKMTLRGGKSVMLTRRSSRCPRSLENPHRTRVPTFPQQRLRRRTNLSKLQNPPKSQGLTDSCAEPKFDASQLHEEPVGIRWDFQTLTVGFDQHLQVVFGFEPSPTSVERYSQTSQVKNSPLNVGVSKRSTVSGATPYVPRPPPPATSLCRRGSDCWVRGQSRMRSPGIVKSHVSDVRFVTTTRFAMKPFPGRSNWNSRSGRCAALKE